jgi:hypothetical protein
VKKSKAESVSLWELENVSRFDSRVTMMSSVGVVRRAAGVLQRHLWPAVSKSKIL